MRIPSSPTTISSDRSTQMPTNVSGSHPQPLQMPGQLIGAFIELAIGQLFVFKDDGRRFRRALDLLLEQFMNAFVPRVIPLRLVPLHQQLLALGIRQQGQIRQPLIRI